MDSPKADGVHETVTEVFVVGRAKAFVSSSEMYPREGDVHLPVQSLVARGEGELKLDLQSIFGSMGNMSNLCRPTASTTSFAALPCSSSNTNLVNRRQRSVQARLFIGPGAVPAASGILCRPAPESTTNMLRSVVLAQVVPLRNNTVHAQINWGRG